MGNKVRVQYFKTERGNSKMAGIHWQNTANFKGPPNFGGLLEYIRIYYVLL